MLYPDNGSVVILFPQTCFIIAICQSLPAKNTLLPLASTCLMMGMQRVVCPAPQSSGATKIFFGVWLGNILYFYKSIYEKKKSITPPYLFVCCSTDGYGHRKLQKQPSLWLPWRH
jgi:hypothetical protein